MRHALLLVLLAGCTTVGPDYSRPEVSLPPSFPSAPAQEQQAISTDWWKLYGDRQLEELIASAQKTNADLRLAAARVLEAEALAREAGAAFLPEVTGGYATSRNRVSERTIPAPQAGVPLERRQHQLLASTSFELDFWGRFSRASEAARANLLSSV